MKKLLWYPTRRIITLMSLLLFLGFFIACVSLPGCSGGGGGTNDGGFFTSGSPGAPSNASDKSSSGFVPNPQATPAEVLAQIPQNTPQMISPANVITQTSEANFILCRDAHAGSPIDVDDQVFVYLNGALLYQSPDTTSGAEAFISFYAETGDTLQVKAFDYYGYGRGISPLWLYHIPTGQSVKLSDGYDGSFYWPWPSQEWFFDESYTIPDFSANLAIENAKATPGEFTPDPKPTAQDNKTEISAQIVAETGSSVDSVEWQVTIKDKAETVVRTFDTRTAASGAGPWDVLEIWYGENNTGDYVDYGEYTFVIKATGNPGTAGEIMTEATGLVKVAPPFPVLTKMNFNQDAAVTLLDDAGKKIPPTYYENKDGNIEANPTAIALENLPDAQFPSASAVRSETNRVKKVLITNLEFENPAPSDKYYVHWDIEAKDRKSGDSIEFKGVDGPVKSYRLSFPPKVKKVSFDNVPLIFDRVREIDSLDVSYSWTDHPIYYTTIVTPESIAMPLGCPLEPPIDRAAVNKGFMDIACHLAENVYFTEPPDDAQKEARIQILENLYKWFQEKTFENGKRFIYNPGNNYFDKDMGRFKYASFMRPVYGPPGIPGHPVIEFEGSCETISAFYILCCAAHGIPIKMKTLMPKNLSDKSFETRSARSCAAEYEWVYDPPTDKYTKESAAFRRWDFESHSISYLPIDGDKGYAFDPTLKFVPSSPCPIGYVSYIDSMIYKDLILAIWGHGVSYESFEYLLQKVDWPDKKQWWNK
jgi:hypothetical protein